MTGPEGPEVLFIGHGAERSGPPIFLANLQGWLATHTDLRFATLLARGGPFVAEYRRHGPVTVLERPWAPARLVDRHRSAALGVGSPRPAGTPGAAGLRQHDGAVDPAAPGRGAGRGDGGRPRPRDGGGAGLRARRRRSGAPAGPSGPLHRRLAGGGRQPDGEPHGRPGAHHRPPRVHRARGRPGRRGTRRSPSGGRRGRGRVRGGRLGDAGVAQGPGALRPAGGRPAGPDRATDRLRLGRGGGPRPAVGAAGPRGPAPRRRGRRAPRRHPAGPGGLVPAGRRLRPRVPGGCVPVGGARGGVGGGPAGDLRHRWDGRAGRGRGRRCGRGLPGHGGHGRGPGPMGRATTSSADGRGRSWPSASGPGTSPRSPRRRCGRIWSDGWTAEAARRLPRRQPDRGAPGAAHLPALGPRAHRRRGRPGALAWWPAGRGLPARWPGRSPSCTRRRACGPGPRRSRPVSSASASGPSPDGPGAGGSPPGCRCRPTTCSTSTGRGVRWWCPISTARPPPWPTSTSWPAGPHLLPAGTRPGAASSVPNAWWSVSAGGG